ncbi:MAG: DUF4214 domain-containing protein [Candidatus Rifleibacteriota bacterium]
MKSIRILFFPAVLMFCLLFIAVAVEAQTLYDNKDAETLKSWYKNITGKNMPASEVERSLLSLNKGTRDMDELRRDFVNSKDGLKNLDPLSRIYWGFLAREIDDKARKHFEDLVKDYNPRDFEDEFELSLQISGLNHLIRSTAAKIDWSKAPRSMVERMRWFQDELKRLKRDRQMPYVSLEQMRSEVTSSKEYVERKISKLFRRYLKRDADAGAIRHYSNQYYKRSFGKTIPEFWNDLRIGLIKSDEGKKLYRDKVDRLYLMHLRRFADRNEKRSHTKSSDKDLDFELKNSKESISRRVNTLYRWVFGRNADKGGLNNWTQKCQDRYKKVSPIGNQRILVRGWSLAKLARHFAKSPTDILITRETGNITYIERIKAETEIQQEQEKIFDEAREETINEDIFTRQFLQMVLREPAKADIDNFHANFSFRAANNKSDSDEIKRRTVEIRKFITNLQEFRATSNQRKEEFLRIFGEIFLRKPDARELKKYIAILESGDDTIEGLAAKFVKTSEYKDLQAKIAKGEIPFFKVGELSPQQQEFVEEITNRLYELNFEMAELYRNFLFRQPTEEELKQFATEATKFLQTFDINILPENGFSIRELEKYRVKVMNSLKNLDRNKSSFLNSFKQKLLASREFKDQLSLAEIKIHQLYIDLIGRRPDAGGLKHYLERFTRGELSIDQIKQTMKNSQEYKKYLAARTKPSPGKSTGEDKNENKKVASQSSDDAKTLRDLDPFKKYEWADKISIKDLKTIERGDDVEITGKASLFGLRDKDLFIINTRDVYGVQTWVAGIRFEGNWTPEQFYPDASGEMEDMLKLLKVNGGALVVSVSDFLLQSQDLPKSFREFLNPIYKTTRTDNFTIKLEYGMNMLARLSLNHDPVKKVMSLIKYRQNEILLQGILPTNPKKFILRGYFQRFNTPDWMPDGIKTIQPHFEFSGTPHIVWGATLRTDLPGAKQPVDIFGEIKVPIKPTENYTLTGGISGTWDNPFDLEGFSLSNLVVTCKPNTNSFGIAGTSQIGTRVVSVAGQAPLAPGAWGLRGQVNELNLDDLVILSAKLGAKVRHEDLPLPKIGLKDLDLMISGVDDSTLGLYKGIVVDGKFFFNNENIANIFVRTWKYGIIGKGNMNSIDVGPLKITGGSKYEKGPELDMELSITSQHLRFSGMVDIFDLSRELHIFLTKTRISFELTDKIFNAFTAVVKANGTLDIKSPNFGLEASMKADLINSLTRKIEDVTKGELPDAAKRVLNNIFEVTEAGFKGSLDEMRNGNTPGFWAKFRCLGKRYSVNTSFNFKDHRSSVENLAKKIGNDIIDKIEAFFAKIQQQIENAVKRITAAIKKTAEKVVNTVKGWFGKGGGSSSSSAKSKSVIKVNNIAHSVHYWK